MEELQIYTKNTQDSIFDFEIFKIGDLYEKRGGKADSPHKHDYYTILFLIEGSGIHRIDFNDFEMSGNQVFFVSPGQVHQVIEKSKPKGFAILFSEHFLIKNYLKTRFIEDINLFNNYGFSPPLEINKEESDKLELISEELFKTYNSDIKFKSNAISSWLQLFLISCNNLCSLNPQSNHEIHSAHGLLSNFKELIEKYYKEWHQTSKYADALFVTADHLNRVVKSLTGKTAKEFIQSRIITDAKRMFYYTDFTNKQIGYELGFSEPANFSAFFKKCTGKSPSKFRKELELM
jgi:AraC-like DNA-binding protein